jgi:hypothetical protein
MRKFQHCIIPHLSCRLARLSGLESPTRTNIYMSAEVKKDMKLLGTTLNSSAERPIARKNPVLEPLSHLSGSVSRKQPTIGAKLIQCAASEKTPRSR